jgi:hypothetical protein
VRQKQEYKININKASMSEKSFYDYKILNSDHFYLG